MYLGQLAAASNRADWSEIVTLSDKDTGDLIDISLCSITMTLRPQLRGSGDDFNNAAASLTGSTDSGEIVLIDVGTFQWTFPASSMAALCERTYEVGVRISQDDRTMQLIIGEVPILEGIDTQ